MIETKKCFVCEEVRKCKKVVYIPAFIVGRDNYVWKCKDCLEYEKYKENLRMKEKEKELKKYRNERDKVIKKLRGNLE